MRIARGGIPFLLAVGLGLSHALLARFVFGAKVLIGSGLLSLVAGRGAAGPEGP